MQQIAVGQFYEVYYDEEQEDFIGICPAYKTLQWRAGTADDAYMGIKVLVKSAIEDLQETD